MLSLVLLVTMASAAGVFADGPAAGPPPTHQPRTNRNNLEIRIDAGRYSAPLLGLQLSIFPRTSGRNDLMVDLSRIDWRIVDAVGRNVAPHSAAERKSPDWFNPSSDGSTGRVITLEGWKGGNIEVGGKRWQLKPGKYAVEAVLDTSSDRPGRMGGQRQPLRGIWIGTLLLPRIPFEVIGEVSDEALAAAAKSLRAAHPAGGEAMWRALAELVRPGMTIHQLQLALPPLSPAAGDLSDTGILWMGPWFFMRYPLDRVWKVQASGCAIAPCAANGDSRTAVVTGLPQIVARAEHN